MSACTFFGHRDCPQSVFPKLKEEIRKLIITNKVKCFYVGNHGAFDRYVHRALCELKKEYPAVEWYVVLAYLSKENNKSEPYKNSLYPEGIESVPLRFAIGYRNKWMLNHSTFVITYVNRSFGGAAQFAALAERQGKSCIKLTTGPK